MQFEDSLHTLLSALVQDTPLHTCRICSMQVHTLKLATWS
jgi:hypothetical protein